MDSKVLELEPKINSLISEVENDFSPDRLMKIKKRLDDYVKDIDLYFASIFQEDKINKAKLLLLKGKLLDLLPEYSKQAEESLSKALKLNPLDTDCWNTLGHILWKKKDLLGSKKCFECSIEQNSKNKIALRNLSIVLRSLGQNEERKENVLKSIELAKTALTQDIKDGESWYILGNAYMSNFFVNMKYMSELQNALKAYNQAESNLLIKNPDLHFNRANILSYLEDYDNAIEEYKKAVELDPFLNSKQNIQKIRSITTKTNNYIESRGKIKAKKLNNIIKTIPSSLKSQPKELGENIQYEICQISNLKFGINKGKIFAGKILTIISEKESVPAIFVCVDSKGDFCSLSVFNTSNEVYEKIHELADVFVVDANLKEINVSNETNPIKYLTIQVYEIETLYIDQVAMSQTFSPNIVVNETFQH